MRLKYDFLSMFVCFLLIVSAGERHACLWHCNMPGRGAMPPSSGGAQELYEATYARLKGNGDIVNVTYDVHLGTAHAGRRDRRGGSEGGRLRGCERRAERNVATREEFVARVSACLSLKPCAQGVRDPYISLYMRESRDTETPLYSLAVEGSIRRI